MLWIPCQSSSLFAGLPQTRVLVWFVSKFHLFSGLTNMESATSCQLYELFSSKTCMHHAQKTATALQENPCWRGTRRIRVPMLTNTPAILSRLLHNNRHAPQWATEPQKDRVSWGFGGGGEATPSWMRHHGCPQNLCWGYCINYCRRRFAQVERDVSVKIMFWVCFWRLIHNWHSKHRSIWTPPTLETWFESTDSTCNSPHFIFFWGVEVTMARKHQQKESLHEACGKHTVEGCEKAFVYYMPSNSDRFGIGFVVSQHLLSLAKANDTKIIAMSFRWVHSDTIFS